MPKLKLARVDLYRGRLPQPSATFKSFVEAATYCAENSTAKIVLVFTGEAENEVVLEILGTEFSNVPTFLVGHDSSRKDGLVEIPTTPPPIDEWT